jgi:fatty acid desaturase
MTTSTISLQDYEAAEREFLLMRAKKIWRGHAAVFVAVAATFAYLEKAAGGGIWWPYVIVVAWSVALFVHHRSAVRYGDAHAREEQIRIEWRAGRSKEQFVHR